MIVSDRETIPAAANPLTLRHLEGVRVTQCILVEWHKADGGLVAAGDVVATVETSKVTAEIHAPTGGTLRHKYAQGEYIGINDLIGWIESPTDGQASQAAPPVSC